MRKITLQIDAGVQGCNNCHLKDLTGAHYQTVARSEQVFAKCKVFGVIEGYRLVSGEWFVRRAEGCLESDDHQ